MKTETIKNLAAIAGGVVFALIMTTDNPDQLIGCVVIAGGLFVAFLVLMPILLLLGGLVEACMGSK